MKDMTANIEGMLVGHEVGHALYTTIDMLDASKDNTKLHGYINVLEDVRIEKLMKRKYPGLRKTMIAGYNELNERDFFGVSQIADKSQLLLIDRINLWFKVGLSAGVQFTNTEKMFLNRAEKTENPAEVIELAKEIFEYSKEQKEKQQQQMDDSEVYSDEYGDDEDGEDGYSDYDEEDEDGESDNAEDGEDEDGERDSNEEVESNSDNKESGKGGVSSSQNDDLLESITDKAFSKSLNELADTQFSYQYHTLFDEYLDDIVPYKTVIAETLKADDDPIVPSWNTPVEPLNVRYTKFKSDTNRSVSYLVKEFEMKKAATNYKRSQVSKSGSLDMKKIWGYQLNDDLFKRITTMSTGKNHGMIFLLDWSGSMNTVLHDTIQQVIQLASFCHRVQIPFQVLAFSNYYHTRYGMSSYLTKRHALASKCYNLHNTIDTTDHCTLVELFNHKMSNQEFNTMSKRLFNTDVFTSCENYRLGGTPLNEALAYMTEYVGKFSRANNVEKMSFITLTDGAGDYLRSTGGTLYSSKSCKHFLTDPVTKKSYVFSADSATQSNVLLQMIKERYNANIVGFYIASKVSCSELRSAVYYNGGSFVDIDYAKKQVAQNGYVSIKTNGHDDLFMVPCKTLKIDDGEIEADIKQSATTIARNLTKVMTGRQVNRILLNRFISLIA